MLHLAAPVDPSRIFVDLLSFVPAYYRLLTCQSKQNLHPLLTERNTKFLTTSPHCYSPNNKATSQIPAHFRHTIHHSPFEPYCLRREGSGPLSAISQMPFKKILKHEAYVRLILRKLGGQYEVREGVLIRVWKSVRGDILSLMRSNRLIGMWANVGNA